MLRNPDGALISGKLIGLCLLFLLAAFSAHAQSAERAKTELPLDFSHDPCGNPTIENQIWEVIEGRITRIVDGRTMLVVLKDDHRVLRVRLNAITIDEAAPYREQAKKFLNQQVLNQDAEIWVNPDGWTDKRPKRVVAGVSLKASHDDVATLLLSNGLARREKPRRYSLSAYTTCQYRRAEAEAQSQKLGLWQ